MKVLIRGLNIYDNKISYIDLNETPSINELKRKILKVNKAFRKCKFIITSNGKIKKDKDLVNKDYLYDVRVLLLGGKV